METLKKYFPMSWKYTKDVPNLIKGILIYVVAGLIAGLIASLLIGLIYKNTQVNGIKKFTEWDIRNLLKTNMIINGEELLPENFAKLSIIDYTSDEAADYTKFTIGENGTSLLDLRNDAVYAFTTSNPNVEFIGLDKNQSYYVNTIC